MIQIGATYVTVQKMIVHAWKMEETTNMRKLIEFMRSVKRSALIESGKIVFSLIGVGTTLANLSVCKFWQFGVAAVLLSVVWGSIYLQMEVI